MSPFFSTSAKGAPALSERAVMLLLPEPSSGFAQPRSPRRLMVNRLAFLPSLNAHAPRLVSAFAPSIRLLFDPCALGLMKPRLPPSENPLTGIDTDAPNELKPAASSERWPYWPVNE